jgi:hypothetical protein
MNNSGWLMLLLVAGVGYWWISTRPGDPLSVGVPPGSLSGWRIDIDGRR